MKKYSTLLILALLLSCNKKNQEIAPESLSFEVSLAIEIKEGVYIESSGRTGSDDLSEMDFLGVVIESYTEGNQEYSLYANGLFDEVPTSLTLDLIEGKNFRVSVLVFRNRMDSVVRETFLSYAFDFDVDNELNQFFYGDNAISMSRNDLLNDFIRFYQKEKDETTIADFPRVDAFYAETDLTDLNQYSNPLEFQQQNHRVTIQVSNATIDSQINLGLGIDDGINNYRYHGNLIDSDTTYNLYFRIHPFESDQMNLRVEHKYELNEIDITDLLYNDNFSINSRMGSTVIEIVTPELPGEGNSAEEIISITTEEYSEADTIRVGG